MKRASLILCFITLLAFSSKAQLVADFVADTLSFCPPRTVRFTDLSTGGNITSRVWTFSPTQSSNSNNPFPIATYTAPGTYSVTLTISDGVRSATVTKNAYIKVFQPPTAAFSIPGSRQECAPFTVQVNNQSTPGDAPINWTRFTMGDGGVSFQNAPNYTYSSGGLFSLNLQLIDTNGCQASASRSRYVQVYSKPTAAFSTNNSPHDCQAPHLVEFNDNSRGNGPFQYFWTFGDGNVSTLANPNHTYGTGIFDVSLRIRDANGCRDTLTKTAYASVTTTKAAFDVPDTICMGDSVFIRNLSVGGNAYSWDFGDGTSSTDRDVYKVYGSTGQYRIKLSISAGVNCFDSVSKVIYVDDLQADFTQTKIFDCEPTRVNYQDASTGNRINSWRWDFSHGDTSEVHNPSILFQDPGSYDARLIVQNVYGCRDTIIKTNHFNIAAINAVIWNDVDSGCSPLTVSFIDRSSPRDSVVSRRWDWGDGTAQDTSVNPVHTFQQAGLYLVRLTVTSPSGCDYSATKRILVGTKQNADFVINKDSICAGDGFDITNTSTDSLMISSYHWQFSDGGEMMAKDPSPYLPVDTGLFDISLIVEHNGCFDTIQKNDVVYVLGPVGQMSLGQDCNIPYDVNVLGINWKEVQRFKWNMGDFVGYDSTRKSFTYTYANRGRFNVQMKLYNDSNGCKYEKDSYVEIYDLKVGLSVSDTIFCTPKELRLVPTGSQDASMFTYTNMATGKDTITNSWSVPFTSNTKGFHDFRLIGVDPNGCRDTVFKKVRGLKPNADFVVSDTLGCFPLTTTFRDRTISDTTIRFYRWFLGAGLQGSDSVETVTYPLKGNFGVQLQVEDIYGCRDTVTKRKLIDIRQPEIYFDPDSMLCAGDSINLSNLNHKSIYTYQWTSPPNLSLDSSARFGFHQGGMHDIRAIVEDTMGCTDTMIRTVNVQHIPNARISATPRDTNCYPALVTFQDATNHPNIEWRTWTFGLGDPPVTRRTQTMSYTYPYPGKYDVSLIVETTFGCRDTISVSEYISVGGPYAEFDLLNDTACVGELVTFNLDSLINTFRLDWDFGDGFGKQLPGDELFSTHVYKTPGTYSIKVLLNDTAFDCLTSVEDTIQVFEVNAALSSTDTTGCAPLSVQFNDLTPDADSRRWYGMSGLISQDSSDLFSFPEAGEYPISLVAIDSKTGCADTARRRVKVWPVPEVEISDDTVLCLGDNVLLRASGGTSYRWSPWQGLSSTSDSVVIATPKEAVTYSVLARNDFNCSTMDSIRIEIQEPYEFQSGEDTIIFLGESTPLLVSSADTNLLFRWNPVNDLNCNLCPNPIASPQVTTLYTASITDPYGCFQATATMNVIVEEEFEVHIPNAFTPNGDDVNDWFYAVTYGIKEFSYLRVFDRWGKVIFIGEDFDDKWDGFVAGSPCPIGTYVWEFEGIRFNDRKVNLVGTINLIR